MLKYESIRKGLKDYHYTYKYFYQLMGLSKKLAKRYNESYDDIKQIVLIMATRLEKKYQQSKTGRFVSFVEVSTIRELNKLYHISEKRSQKVYKYIQQYKKEHNEMPNVSQIAEALGISRQEVIIGLPKVSPEEFADFCYGSDFYPSDIGLEEEVELEEMLTKGFNQLNDLQKTLVKRVILQAQPKAKVGKLLGLSEKEIDKQLDDALSILKPYVL